MANISKYPLVSYQPFRLLYQLAAAASIIARLPVWIVIGLVPSLRPNRQWSCLQTVVARFLRASLHKDSVIGLGEAETPVPHASPRRGRPLRGRPAVRRAPVHGAPLLRPLRDPGTRGRHLAAGPSTAVPRRGSKQPEEGGNAHPRRRLRARPPAHPGVGLLLSATLLAHAGADAVFSPRYRLSGHGGRNPFPARCRSALTAYLYLVRGLGLPPQAVTLSGDSAGGNIAVALLRYLSEHGGELGVPPPGRVVLIAPWVAPAACFPRRPVGEPSVEEMAHYGSDILPASFMQWGVRTYAPEGDVEATRDNPYIQALGHPFRARAPVLVSVGGAEILSTDGAAWAREMVGYEGGGVNEVEVHIEVDAPHDTLLAGDSLKWEDSAARVAARIGEFIDKTQA
ncbi:hypothetical protein INS49_013639 [Diaporthe citri]|uniref:uncharacterized protein n=1 Tax=Diaporthe citri TaxID=83186 RepID=UPI001C7E25DE|nr:uncharacterized protein INS49_013639 [Diaporthe citri]KAG6357760.1 hypothetical protein INS49_013639 [Diaporthe citri]